MGFSLIFEVNTWSTTYLLVPLVLWWDHKQKLYRQFWPSVQCLPIWATVNPILEFIYTGQASFYQERMKEFLRVGKEVPELENTFFEESVVDTYLRHNSGGQVKGW